MTKKYGDVLWRVSIYVKPVKVSLYLLLDGNINVLVSVEVEL